MGHTEVNVDEHHSRLEQMFHGSPVNRQFGSTLSIDGPGSATVLTPVQDSWFHPGGAVHAVVYYWALEVATYFAAASVVDDAFLVNVNLEADITRPVNAGTLTVEGELVSRSRRVLIAQGTITDDDGIEVGRGRGLFVPTGRHLDQVG